MSQKCLLGSSKRGCAAGGTTTTTRCRRTGSISCGVVQSTVAPDCNKHVEADSGKHNHQSAYDCHFRGHYAAVLSQLSVGFVHAFHKYLKVFIVEELRDHGQLIGKHYLVLLNSIQENM
jgi:hypothetical protein